MNWKNLPRKIQAQYHVGGRGSQYAERTGVQLAGDDQTLEVTVDVMATPTELVLSFYRYTENFMNDFQLTFSHPVANVTEAQELAAATFSDNGFITLRYLKANGFIDWLDA